MTGNLENAWLGTRKYTWGSRPDTAVNVGQDLLSLLHGNRFGDIINENVGISWTTNQSR